MFTLTEIPIKFVSLIILFVITTLISGQQTFRPGQDWRARVSSGWHLWMSIVMLLMVPKSWWMPFVKVIPVWFIELTFLVAVVWSLSEGIRHKADKAKRLIHFGNAAMMGAMAWHLVGMMIKRSHMPANPKDMAGMKAMKQWMMEASKTGGELWWIALIGVPFMAWLLYAAIRDLLGVFKTKPACGCHDTTGQSPLEQRLGALCGFAMNFGMFWMSTGLMIPLLPFFKYLAF